MASNPDIIESLDTLRSSRFFQAMDEQEFRDVSELIKLKHYRKDKEVIPYKENSDDVFFIASGKVRIIIYSYTGKEISYQELLPGEMFGELSAIDQKPRTANVITSEPGYIGSMSRTDFWHVVEAYPGFSGAVMKRLAGMVRFLADRVYQYGALDVKDRVRAEVLRLARQESLDNDNAVITDFPTHTEIASRINTHREAVTRELNELSRMGLISQDQRTLKVNSVAQLAELLPEDI